MRCMLFYSSIVLALSVAESAPLIPYYHDEKEEEEEEKEDGYMNTGYK